MQLVFEVCDNASGEAPLRKMFDGVGGVIGRGAGCDWVIPDATRLLSSHHALIGYRDGQYFLTDVSSNGIGVAGDMERLRKGQARLIADGDVYQLGALDIRAQLRARWMRHDDRQALVCTDTIPNDAFLGLDPLHALACEQQRDESSEELDALAPMVETPTCSFSHGALERDHLTLPRWAEPSTRLPSPPSDPIPPELPPAFWVQFGDALGLRTEALDSVACEALAIRVAGLFRQTVEGVQQCLRTRDELNNELKLSAAMPGFKSHNPLKDCLDTQATMTALLGAGELGQLSAELVLAQACRDMQVHQLALVVACRAAVRGALAAFAPSHLMLCFEREGKPARFTTDGACWRAYQRHYRHLVHEHPLGEQLLNTDFSKAYEEQVRLVSTLHAAYPG
ncbi:type VI secretion system-associated FHA domain protein TagH [Pseudomonas rhodesiae]|uniref:type VI secretion system-associated FHA domain protein TagH n=1 Tax=Pseudomonas rhodesiae TaxID=76760 RepID=UPI0032B2FA21